MSQTKPKNIVICCDGTGNQFGNHNSNVIKLFSVLRKNSPDQILYYHPGVGTKASMRAPTTLGLLSQKIKKWHAFAYGYGILDNLAHAYEFLMRHYESGDRVYVIGFSRGAFTARTLCSLVYEFGLLEEGNDSLIDYAMGLFLNTNPESLKIAQNFKPIFGRECPIHFVGVWDTVSAVGWIYNPIKIPFTRENPNIKIGRQALAIDERRVLFRPNLWGCPADDQDFKQVWFAGVHADVGGGYSYAESGLSNISLQWMIEEAAEAGLMIDTEAEQKMLQNNPPDPNGPIHHSLKKIWWAFEYTPIKVPHRIDHHVIEEWELHKGRQRRIPEKSLIHESVLQRMENPQNHYHPLNLPKTYEVVA